MNGAGQKGSAGTTLSEQVYTALRKRIYRGDWLPGTKLTLRGLAAELGTSVQPIRDGIGRLTAEKALVIRRNHMVLLPPIDRAMLDEIFAMRTMLEGEAARRCAQRFTSREFDALEQASRNTRAFYASADITGRILAIHEMAMILANGCGSALLAEQVMILRTRSAPYYAAAMINDKNADPEFISFTIRIQDEFLAALKRRDAESAAELRKSDLYTFQHHIYRLLNVA